MTEGPGLGGYPDLPKPGTRWPQAYRGFLRAALEETWKNTNKIQKIRHALKPARRR